MMHLSIPSKTHVADADLRSLADHATFTSWLDVVVVVDETTGRPVGFLAPEVPTDAPDGVREGMDRRVEAFALGQCLCGARLQWGTRAPRRRAVRAGKQPSGQPVVNHRSTCPGNATVLADAVVRWKSAGA